MCLWHSRAPHRGQHTCSMKPFGSKYIEGVCCHSSVTVPDNMGTLYILFWKVSSLPGFVLLAGTSLEPLYETCLLKGPPAYDVWTAALTSAYLSPAHELPACSPNNWELISWSSTTVFSHSLLLLVKNSLFPGSPLTISSLAEISWIQLTYSHLQL